MKKILLLLISVFSINCYAVDLVGAYQQALTSDPIFQEAVAQRLANREAVPISLSSLLPNAYITAYPSISKATAKGSATFGGSSTTNKGYNTSLVVTQTIFNFANFANLAGARAFAKGADATFNAALQDLMIRVSKAYFEILNNEDNLFSIESTKAAYAKQLNEAIEMHKVGLKTITDVYTAQASYESAVSDYITAETRLKNSKENMRVITGVYYNEVDDLKEAFPLVTPQPADVETWVDAAQHQNWSIKAFQYAAETARATIKQQFAGHLPTLEIQGTYNINSNRTIGDDTLITLSGSSKIHNKSVQLNLGIPLVQGGLVVAQTRQAQENYRVAIQQLEQQLRNTINQTRQSYLEIIAGISKITADKKAIKSSISSLQGMEAGYTVGTEILVNVLNQQQKVFEAELQYAHDRYAYVNNLLALKQATGTLSPDDLQTLNGWLTKKSARRKIKNFSH